ncbi:MAG: hypothetical protein PHX54_08425 [Lentimicrobiaceae bacterium]|nr:hypothetical protein [Lentimicrobiaceae bacterium]
MKNHTPRTYNEIKLMRMNLKQHLKHTEGQIKARTSLVYQDYKIMVKGEMVKNAALLIFKLLGKRLMHRFSR